MVRDPRGGHNRKKINEDFFKCWSPQMSYVLGLIFADGTIEDVRSSSRTCYIDLSSKDKYLVEKLRYILSSKHKIYMRKPQMRNFSNGTFMSSRLFSLRIGNKMMYQDLINLGVTPRKSLTMEFPLVPRKYLHFFLRGYSDGDGCVNIYRPKDRNAPRIWVIFTSGSFNFLTVLAEILNKYVGTERKIVLNCSGAYRLIYSKNDSLKALRFIYQNIDESPYLQRKYRKYAKFILN